MVHLMEIYKIAIVKVFEINSVILQAIGICSMKNYTQNVQ